MNKESFVKVIKELSKSVDSQVSYFLKSLSVKKDDIHSTSTLGNFINFWKQVKISDMKEWYFNDSDTISKFKFIKINCQKMINILYFLIKYAIFHK